MDDFWLTQDGLIWYADCHSSRGFRSVGNQEPRTSEKEEAAEDFNKKYDK